MRARTTRGFSLLEVMISLVGVAVVGLAVNSVTANASSAIRENAVRYDASVRGDGVVEQLARLLRSASLSNLTCVPPGFVTPQTMEDGDADDDLGFRRMEYSTATSDSVPTLSAAYALALADSPGDPVNGVDDDSDGVIDGRDLVLTRPGEAPTVIARRVMAFGVALNGRSLTLNLTQARRLDETRVGTFVHTETVEIRND